MPVEMTAHPDMINRDSDISPVEIVQRQAFVDDGAVTRTALQGLAQVLRGGRDVIEPADLPEIGLQRKMEPKEDERRRPRSAGRSV